MQELSIFIDESGDFGEVKERPSYYLVTMVFHDQTIDLSKEIEVLEESIRTFIKRDNKNDFKTFRILCTI